MSAGKLTLYVRCFTEASAKRWTTLAGTYDDLDLKPIISTSAIETIRQLCAATDKPFLICRETIWIARGMRAHVEELVDELDSRFPNWGLCGNRGIRWDGQQIYDYTYDTESAGLQTAVCAHAAMSVDDSMLLVNPQQLNRHTILAPSLNRQPSLLLSLECLQNGSSMAVSPHLLVMRTEDAQDEEEDGLDADPVFREFYRTYFLNHRLATCDGTLDFSEVLDYRFVAEPWTSSAQRDVLDLYDKVMEASRAVRRPSLTVCCRTQFRRPEMLERAVLSFAAFRQHAGDLADVEVRLISDTPGEIAELEVRRLQETYPAAALECWHHEICPQRYSRTDLLLAAIERAATDYIWFIDDDDFANAAAAPAMARSLVAGAPMLVVTSSAIVREKWAAKTHGHGQAVAQNLELTHAEKTGSYQAADIFRILRGSNFIPICSMALPVPLMRERISKMAALGNYNEDYFLLLLALTAPRIEVSVVNCEMASVSIRGEENTIAQKDREGWNSSLTTFLLEILNNEEGNSPFLWQLANERHW